MVNELVNIIAPILNVLHEYIVLDFEYLSVSNVSFYGNDHRVDILLQPQIKILDRNRFDCASFFVILIKLL